MERARTVEDFVANPVGRFYLGPTHVVWCWSRSLCGAVNWGHPDETDAANLVAAFQFTLGPAFAGGFSLIIDSRELERASPASWWIVLEGIKAFTLRWHRLVRRQAVLMPTSIVAVLLAGLAPLAEIVYPLRLFHEVGAAIRWLDHSELRTALDSVDRIVNEARGVPPLLRELRVWLERTLQHATLEDAARELGRPPRTLQRDLELLKTSFRRELDLARVRAASALLEDGDEKIEVIARRVGFGSASRLSTMFRRTIGETPGEHRDRLRRR